MVKLATLVTLSLLLPLLINNNKAGFLLWLASSTMDPLTCRRVTISEEDQKYLPKRIRHGRFYIKGEVVTFEEDQTHEFKGHRNISLAEVPPWCVKVSNNTRTRNAISRNLCGFLNSGQGGTVYVGVLDNGMVDGVYLTVYQQDHMLLSLQDTLKSFRPPVPRFMYHVELIPVIEYGRPYPSQFLPVPEEVRLQPHQLRTYRNCWCDHDSLAWFHLGIIPHPYVVEITIYPVDKHDPRIRSLTNCKMPTLPVFQCEDNQVYVRMLSSLVQYSMRDVAEQAKEEVLLYRMPELMQAYRRSVFFEKLNEVVSQAVKDQEESTDKEVGNILYPP